MADAHNPIRDRIFDRVNEPGDEIIAHIAYGLYKERKKAYLTARRDELNAPVPPVEVDSFVRAYDDGQIDLVWSRAQDVLATFAVTYAEAEKQTAVRKALKDALRGNFWRHLWINAWSGVVITVVVLLLYLLARLVGFDPLDLFVRLDTLLERVPAQQ